MVVEGADAVGAEPYLAGGFLAGDIQRAVGVGGGLGGDVEQQGGFADAWFAGQQGDGAGDESAAEDAVELGHAGGAGGGLRAVDLADGHGGGGDPAGGGGAHRGAPPNSSTVPHAWHSGQRPSHLAVVQPHSVQR